MGRKEKIVDHEGCFQGALLRGRGDESMIMYRMCGKLSSTSGQDTLESRRWSSRLQASGQSSKDAQSAHVRYRTRFQLQ